MDLNNIDISKLPSDVRKTFRQLQVMHAEKKIQNKAKEESNDVVIISASIESQIAELEHNDDKLELISNPDMLIVSITLPMKEIEVVEEVDEELAEGEEGAEGAEGASEEDGKPSDGEEKPAEDNKDSDGGNQ